MTVLFRNVSALLLALLFSGALVSAQDLQPKKTGLPGRTVWALATSGTTSVTTFAATDKGLWRSTDNGTSWTETTLKNQGVYAVKSRQIGSTMTLLVGTDKGVLRSTDGGNSWVSPEVTTGTLVVTSNILSLKKVFDIEIVGTTWYAATEKGVFRSTNDGRTWSLVNIDRTADNNEVRGITAEGNTVIVNLWKEGLWRSTNGGSSWAKLTITGESALCRSVFAHQATNGTVWLAGAVSGNLWRSTNSGNSWTKVATSSSVQRSATANTFAGMDALTSLGKAIISGTATGLAVSVDNGITWKQIQTATPKPISLVSDGKSVLYVGVDNTSKTFAFAEKGSSAELTAPGDGVGTYQIPLVWGFGYPQQSLTGTPITLDFIGANLRTDMSLRLFTNPQDLSGTTPYSIITPFFEPFARDLGQGAYLRIVIAVNTPGNYYSQLCLPGATVWPECITTLFGTPFPVAQGFLPPSITSIAPSTILLNTLSPTITISGSG